LRSVCQRSDVGQNVNIRVDAMAKDVMGVETWIDGLHTIPTEDRESARGKIIKGRPPVQSRARQSST
jgi:hypothetical protein